MYLFSSLSLHRIPCDVEYVVLRLITPLPSLLPQIFNSPLRVRLLIRILIYLLLRLNYLWLHVWWRDHSRVVLTHLLNLNNLRLNIQRCHHRHQKLWVTVRVGQRCLLLQLLVQLLVALLVFEELELLFFNYLLLFEE